jgi:hypothetical protein
MSLLQATSLITSGVKALKTDKLPDLSGTVNALSAAGVLSKDEATVVKAGLSLANTIERGTSPNLSIVTNSLSAVGILTKSEAKSLVKQINVSSSSLSSNTVSSPTKLLATLTKSGVIDSSTSKLLTNGLSIITSAANGNINGVISGSLKLAGVSSNVAKAATDIMKSVPSTIQVSKASSGYETKVEILPNIGTPGTLTKDDCVKLLKACQMAIHKKYVVNGKRNNWRKVHNRGEYGAYRMSVSQLIDIDFLKPEIQEWAEESIHSRPTGPGAAERVKTYAEAVQETDGDYDFAPYKREAANNLQYFFLYNPIPLNYDAAVRSMISFVTSEEMQDKAAYYYLKKAFVDLSNAKIITATTNKATIAGFLSIALCSKLDDAIRFSQGIIKTNSDGINSKYWYDAGWNALAETPKASNSDEHLLKSGVRQPTTDISTKALIETAKDLSDVLSGKNIDGVVSGLIKNGIIPGDVGGIINAGLGIAASTIKDKLSEISQAKDALEKASSILPANTTSALKSITSISSKVGGITSKVPSISSIASKNNIAKLSSAPAKTTSLAKKITSLAADIENTATSAVGSAVGAVGASGKVDPASLSFIGESLKSGFGLANDPQTAVINELNRRGLCPPGSTALLRASIDGITDPTKIADLIASETNKMGNVGSAIPALNTKLIEQTGAKPGLLDKFEQAKAEAISAIGVTKPELTGLISSAGSASMESLKNQASKAAGDLLNNSSTAVSGLKLANNLTSVTASAKDPAAAASALGASAVSNVTGAVSAATDAISGIAGNAQGALNSASGNVTSALSNAASNVSGMLDGSSPTTTATPAEGQIVSTYLPVTSATVPPTPQTGAASADAVPTLPSTQISAAVGGPTQASTPPVDPNPMKSTYGSVEVSYQWTASNGVVTLSTKGTPLASVNLIDKTDTKTSQYSILISAIDGAIKQERINNYTPKTPKTFEQNLGNALYPQNSGALPLREIPIIATVIPFMSDHAIKVDGLTPINYESYRTKYIIPLNRPQGTESIDDTLTREIESTMRDIVELTQEAATDPTGSTAKWDLPTAEAWLDVLNSLKREQKNIIFNYNKWVRDKNNPPLGPDTALSNDLISAKSGIAGEYTTNLEKVKKTFSNNTPVASQGPSKANTDGSTTTVVTEKYGDGSVVTTTIVEDQKGFASSQKEVTRVAPPIATPSPNTNPPVADSVQHPAQDANDQSVTQAPPNVAEIPISNSSTNGFSDPVGQYPKAALGGKPDINPLAIGVNSPNIQNDPTSQGANQDTLSTGASPVAKNALRKKDVPKAGRNGGSWSQPETPYAARYPYNKVTASESGHVTEIDDTPGAERIHTAHKSGTFQEIGPNGTQVTRIVGDNYTIIDSNGYILIEGRANVHVAGECNVMIMGDANLTMNGKVNMDVHNDFNLNVAGHFGLSVGGGIFIRNEGVFSHDNKGDMQVHSAGNFNSTIDGTHNLTASGYKVTSKGDYHVKVSGVSYHTSVGNINQDTDGSILSKAAVTIDSKSGTHTNIESLGNTNIKSAGSVNTESIAATNIKSANVINAQATDSVNVKSGNAVNVNSTSATNIKSGAAINAESAAATSIKSGAAINVEGAGNINLKAPEVASSKFSAPTIDVSTLNAATTNLKGTHNAPDDTTNIKGSASPVSPGSAATAATAGNANSADAASEATGAKIATLANPIPVEKPVSVSASPIVAGTDGNQTTASGGNTQPINSAGGGQFNIKDFEREKHD